MDKMISIRSLLMVAALGAVAGLPVTASAAGHKRVAHDGAGVVRKASYEEYEEYEEVYHHDRGRRRGWCRQQFRDHHSRWSRPRHREHRYDEYYRHRRYDNDDRGRARVILDYDFWL
ncbi:MAG TPA: hypothetical protein ENK49_10525 [Gammaproteobacteria bacterium]|nr:hypothetical protein [Gammaproteobacteria bacterium]